MKKATGELSEDQRDELLSWLTDRYDEMKPDAASIRDESPNLLPAIRVLIRELKAPGESGALPVLRAFWEAYDEGVTVDQETYDRAEELLGETANDDEEAVN